MEVLNRLAHKIADTPAQTHFDATYLLTGNAQGSVFSNAVPLEIKQDVSGEQYRALSGHFASGQSDNLYLQARQVSSSNRLLSALSESPILTDADIRSGDASPTSGSNVTTLQSSAGSSSSIATNAALLAVTSAGRTAGQFAVSTTGAATYKIPLWTPSGARGLQPNLALTYSSGSPDGTLGPGWSLSGLSGIQRCGKTYADDAGSVAAVTLTTSDEFCQDGNRMRAVTGTMGSSYCGSSYGTPRGVYQTLVSNFSKIISYGTAGNGPSYFVALGKDGLCYEYGNSSTSKAYADAGSTPYGWMLDRVIDRQGNVWKATYTTTQGTIAPDTVEYTATPSTNGLSYPYAYQFTYQTRVTDLSGYKAGGHLQETKVLTKINLKKNGTSVRQYNLTYVTAATTNRDRLQSVQECAGSSGTACLKATTFSYQDGTAGIAAPSVSTGSGAGTGSIFTADIDGDGRLDLIFGVASGAATQWWVQLATTTGYAAPINTGATTTGTAGLLIDDFDAKSGSEVLAPVGTAFYSYKYASGTFTSSNTGIAYASAKQYGAADIDGDGRPDLIELALSGTNNLTVRANTSSGAAVTFASTIFVSQTFNFSGTANVRLYGDNQSFNSPVARYDFNGDGRSDLIIVGYTTTFGWTAWEYAFNGTAFSQTGGAGLGTGGSPNPFIAMLFNDDPCTDLFGTNQVQISGCNGSAVLNVSIPSITALLGADWDGDGRTDVWANSGGTWQVYRSLGSAFQTAISTGISVGSGSWAVTDRDGDGLNDLVFSDASNGYTLKSGVHNGAGTMPDLMTTVQDGWGVKALVTYAPMTSGIYTKYSDAVYPEADVQAPIYLVSQVDQSNGLDSGSGTGLTYRNSFQYFGARVNSQGRGFEGFESTRAIDDRNNLVHVVHYNRQFPYTGTVSEDDLYKADGATLISMTVNTYKVLTTSDLTDTTGSKCHITVLAADTRCYPYLQSSTADSYDLAGGNLIETISASTVIDSYGTIVSATSSTTDRDNITPSPFYGHIWLSTVSNTITTNDETNWCLGRPTRTTTQKSAPGMPSSTRTVDRANDYTACRVTQETIEPTNAALKVVTTFGFDSCGNTNSVSVVGVDASGATMPPRTTTTSYGTHCTFVESITNALSQTSTSAFDYDLGVRTKVTDANGNATSWTYDQFARKTSESRPDGTSSGWAYSDCVSTTCWGYSDSLRQQITQTEYGSSSTAYRSRQTYFDSLDRPKYDQQNRVQGVWTGTKTAYDAIGRKVDVYQPFSGSTNNGYHHFTYDDLNRIVRDDLYNSSGAVDRYSQVVYAGLRAQLRDARGNLKWKWLDVTGQVRRIIDPNPNNGSVQGATTSYDYDGFGNLVTLTDASGNASVSTFNVRGFKTDVNDLDSGHTRYTYDALGELVKQESANDLQSGTSTTIGYDKLGRAITRLEPESTTPTTWTWGASAAAHNIGKIQSIAKPDGYAEAYLYDGVGRTSRVTYTEDAAYQVDYTYNALGLIDVVTYPTSTSSFRFAVKYLYDSYGYLSQVKDNAAGTAFWSLNSANDYSSPTLELLGNAVKVTSGYTPWTNELTSHQEGTGTSPNSIQNLSYHWDSNGNLDQRQDLLQSLTEVVSSDTLNRVTGSTLNGVANLSVSYDAAGNILNKGDVGAYDYTTSQSSCSYTGLTAQPHAVRKAGTATYCYDANGNATYAGGKYISWNSYNQPTYIEISPHTSTAFDYDANHQRWRQSGSYGGPPETTYYVGAVLEKVVTTSATEYRHLIPTGSGYAIYTRRADLSSGTFYITKDHGGSVASVLDSSGTLLARESFTAFGARRGSNWQGNSSDYSVYASTTRRGFTGHEMLDVVSLVNMNGRIYDPYVGRVLSVDPIVQSLDASQALNPYSYVMNNPLSLTDPTGYSWMSSGFKWVDSFFKKWGSTIITVVAAYWGYPVQGAFAASGYNAVVNGGTYNSFIQGVATSGVASGFGGLIGGAVAGWAGATGGSFAAALAQGALIGGFTGGISSAILGGSFGTGFLMGALTGAALAGLSWRSSDYLAQDQEGGADPSMEQGADPQLRRNPHIRFTKNPDGTLESNEIKVSYSHDVSEVVNSYFKVITDYYAKVGIHLRFTLVGEAETLVAGRSDLHLGMCDSSCSGDRGAAEPGGREMLYSRNGYVDTPVHEFGHILGFLHSALGIMGSPMAFGNITMPRAIDSTFVQRVKNCYIDSIGCR